jgi:hypothetical protein
MDDRPAPVVTITDPRRPVEPGDVLVSGDEKPPWRAKRWHYEALGLVVLLALAVVVPQRVVAARAADRRAAIAAVDAAEVAISLGTITDRSPVVRADVTSTGPDPITLESVQLHDPGYSRLTVNAQLPVRGISHLTVPDTRTCSEDLLNGSFGGPPATVRFRVAGREVTRSVPVPPDLYQALTEAAQTRCGFLPGSKALGGRLSVRPVGSQLKVALELTNAGRLPLYVRSTYVLTPGLEVPAGGSYVLVRTGGASTTYSFRLRVTDCTQLRPLVTQGAPIEVQLDTQIALHNGASAGDSVQLTERFPALATAIVALTDQQCGPA